MNDRTGKCLMFRGWNQKVKSKVAIEREKKLMFGLVETPNPTNPTQ
jgi:hypothetical protein